PLPIVAPHFPHDAWWAPVPYTGRNRRGNFFPHGDSNQRASRDLEPKHLDHDAITSPDYVYKPRGPGTSNNHHHGKHHRSRSHNNEPPQPSCHGEGGGELHHSATAAPPSTTSGIGFVQNASSSRASAWRCGNRNGCADASATDSVADMDARKTHVAASATMLPTGKNPPANGATMQQTKLSKSVVVPNGTLSDTNNYPRHGANNSTSTSEHNRHVPSSSSVLPKASPRNHVYSGHSSVVDFLYDTSLLLTPGVAPGTPGATFYSESKYAYSVSGVPGTPAQSSAAAAFFAR
ncbi:hypothetical protein C0J52_05179, partial [Blattella germanica]